MISVSNLRKTISGRVILDGISTTFDQGKVNMVIGSSGTGKSVLLKCLTGLSNIDGGTITYDETKLDKKCNFDKIRKTIGVLFQSGALFEYLTVEENVRFYLDTLLDMDKSSKELRVRECLEQVGMSEYLNRYPRQLSGGMKKRVALARAISHNPKYLFCDEPESGLDPQNSYNVVNLISCITTKYNITTIVISHNIDSMINIGERIIYLKDSKIVWEGTNKDILNVNNSQVLQFLNTSVMYKELHCRSLTQDL